MKSMNHLTCLEHLYYWKRLYSSKVPANKDYAAGTAPENKLYAAGTLKQLKFKKTSARMLYRG